MSNSNNNLQKKNELQIEKIQLEHAIQELRRKRHSGMDDDRAEDIVEDYYRQLLAIEKELNNLK